MGKLLHFMKIKWWLTVGWDSIFHHLTSKNFKFKQLWDNIPTSRWSHIIQTKTAHIGYGLRDLQSLWMKVWMKVVWFIVLEIMKYISSKNEKLHLLVTQCFLFLVSTSMVQILLWKKKSLHTYANGSCIHNSQKSCKNLLYIRWPNLRL